MKGHCSTLHSVRQATTNALLNRQNVLVPRIRKSNLYQDHKADQERIVHKELDEEASFSNFVID